MRQVLTADIAADRASVWAALQRDLSFRGNHVTILTELPPTELRILVRSALGERLQLSYALSEVDEFNTIVVAAVEPAGAGYTLKRLLSFGAVDHGYLHALAIGLANLQAHLEGGDAL
jgi:hypothetical protein